MHKVCLGLLADPAREHPGATVLARPPSVEAIQWQDWGCAMRLDVDVYMTHTESVVNLQGQG